jgi:cell filamentation protein
MSDESMYVYPGTDVLINKLGIQDAEQLARFERIISKRQLSALELNPIKGNFDLAHLQEIHRFIFQDIYPFAGEIRRETIAKDYFTFAPANFIEPAARDLFGQLKREGHLKGLPLEQFADRAAHYMAEINVLHPFREGNGRTQREFIRQLAQNAGFQLDWSKVDPQKLLQASIRSKADTKELAAVIKESLSPLQQNLSIVCENVTITRL